LLAQPGNRKCEEPYSCASSGYQRGAFIGGTWYVRADASPSGSGTLQAPYQTISEALAATAQEVEPNILVGDGEYHENLVITHKVLLAGDCPLDRGTRIIATPPDEPAVTFTVDASGAQFDYFKIHGGSMGILIDGAAGVAIDNEVIDTPDGPGITLDDRKNRAASARIGACVVDGALGGGVVAYGGARLEISGGTIRGSRDPGPGKDACGVCLRASSIVTTTPPDDTGATYWDPRQSTQPSLAITGALIEDNAGTGVSVIGGSATITQSVIRSTGGAGAAEQRIGIDVSERSFGGVPASLVLTQSVVDGMAAIGVRGHDAAITVDRSVIRNIGGAVDTGTRRCLGNGIRARWDHDADPGIEPPTLKVESSVIEDTRESGIFIEGGSASVKKSIVRDTAADPCAHDLGDGIAVYALPGIGDLAPASVVVDQTRIDGSARAPIAAFGGASVEVKDSALLGVRGPYVDSDSGKPELHDTYCGAARAGTWTLCETTAGHLESALLGGAGCDPSDETFCLANCGVDAGISNQPIGIPGIRWWTPDHDEIAPVVTDAQGCYSLEGLPRNGEVLVAAAMPLPPAAVPFDSNSWGLAYTGGQALNTIMDGDEGRRAVVPLYELYATFPFFVGMLHGTIGSPGPFPEFDFDLRNTPNLGVWVCGAHPELAPEGTDVCRDPGRVVTGVEVALEPSLEKMAGPYYADGAVPVLSATYTRASALGALAVFLNVPPGERRVVLKPADIPENAGKKLDCTIDNGRGFASGAWPVERTPNGFRVVLVPAVTSGLWVYCSLE
jgi:hypothetical protein